MLSSTRDCARRFAGPEDAGFAFVTISTIAGQSGSGCKEADAATVATRHHTQPRLSEDIPRKEIHSLHDGGQVGGLGVLHCLKAGLGLVELGQRSACKGVGSKPFETSRALTMGWFSLAVQPYSEGMVVCSLTSPRQSAPVGELAIPSLLVNDEFSDDALS